MPNWLEICWLAIALTVAWIWLCGMSGVKTYTFGPRSGAPARCGAGLIGAAAGRTAAVLRAGVLG